MVKQIPLTRGLAAIVDDDDYATFGKQRWYASTSGGNHVYARRGTLLLHRLIAGATPSEHVDHIDLNDLNCVRSNLRKCMPFQNQGNTLVQSRNKSGFKGVRKHKLRWQAEIRAGGKTTYLGSFADPQEAAMAYDAAARDYFGEFARLNFPRPGEQPARIEVSE